MLPCKELEVKIDSCKRVTHKFVTTSLYLLKFLSKFCSNDASSNLISIQQQQKIKVLLQMIFSLGLTPSLMKGVNTPLKNKSFQLHLLNLEKLSITEVTICCFLSRILIFSMFLSIFVLHLHFSVRILKE